MTVESAFDAIHHQFGMHRGYRALHAKGQLFDATFTATPAAAELSHASFLSGTPTRALVRFSHGSGHPRAKDATPSPHGMAVKFTLEQGGTSDISAQTAPLFTSATPEGFVEFLRAVTPGPLAPARLAKFLIKHPRSIRALAVNAKALRVPSSYGSVRYYGLHAFAWTNAAGVTRYVRYHWFPAEQSTLGPTELLGKDRNFLFAELAGRLTRGPVQMVLKVQVAGPTDSLIDPSQHWSSKDFIEVGTLAITGPNTTREHGDDIVVFDPTRVTDGIELTNDPVLRFRSLAYSESVRQRSGVERGSEAPPLN